ncbi:hypothetical protein BJX64DRAFT_292112 [Aspergillus heterothallicus]
MQERLAPACIALPASAEDVAMVVATLAELPGAVFAIRSSGHSPNLGFANTDRGITLGGGIPAFSLLRGWACDNVANMQVVLASGEIVEANDGNGYADLFVALKGGQSNFGVVIRFDLRTVRQRLYWGGNIASVVTYGRE